MKAEAERVRQDHFVSQAVREKVGQLADNLEKLKALYAAENHGKNGKDPFPSVKATHVRLLNDLCKSLDLDIPDSLSFAFGDPSENADSNGPPKDGSK